MQRAKQMKDFRWIVVIFALWGYAMAQDRPVVVACEWPDGKRTLPDRSGACPQGSVPITRYVRD
jgi:hypothetical protein